MSLAFHWFLPTNGDSRHVVGGGHGSTPGAAGSDRPPSIAYLGQVARSAEQLGFEAVLTPTGAWCEDAWLTTAMLTQVTERLKYLVAFRPGQVSPTLSAQMAATYQRQSVMASSSPACVERVVTTGGEKDVQSETQPALADPIARVWFALEEVARVRQGFGRFCARNSSHLLRRHRHNYTSDRG